MKKEHFDYLCDVFDHRGDCWEPELACAAIDRLMILKRVDGTYVIDDPSIQYFLFVRIATHQQALDMIQFLKDTELLFI